MSLLKTFLSNLLLLLLAGATWWLAENLAPKDTVEAKADSSTVDYYSKNIKRIALTPEGKPKEVLFARRMEHHKDDNSTVMNQPVMTLHKKGGEPWVIRSDSGISQGDGKAVLLNGKVFITRKDSKGKELKIITANVKYLPDQDFAETAEPLRMLAEGDETRATGAQVQFEPTLKITLLADVWRKHETH